MALSSTETTRIAISSATPGQTLILYFPSPATPQPTVITTATFVAPSRHLYTIALPILVLTALKANVVASNGGTLGTVTAVQTPPPSTSSTSAATAATMVMASSEQSWSNAEKGGVIFAAVALLSLILGCFIYTCAVRHNKKRYIRNGRKDVEAGRSPRAKNRGSKTKGSGFFGSMISGSLIGNKRPTNNGKSKASDQRTLDKFSMEEPLVSVSLQSLPPEPQPPVQAIAKIPPGGRHDDGRRSIEREAERIINERRVRGRNELCCRPSDLQHDTYASYRRPSIARYEIYQRPSDGRGGTYKMRHEFSVRQAHPALRPPQPGRVAPQSSVRVPPPARTNEPRISEDTSAGIVGGPSKTWFGIGGIRRVSRLSRSSTRKTMRPDDDEDDWEDATTTSLATTEISPPRQYYRRVQ